MNTTVIAIVVGQALLVVGAFLKLAFGFGRFTEALKALDKRVELLETSLCDKGGES